jgi:hypothetical protein
MKKYSQKKILGTLGVISLALVSSYASAATFVITNGNTSNVSNSVTTSANTGGNTSTGGHGGDAGFGGSAFAAGGSSSAATGGAGGFGGDGGNGGFITTGNAISTSDVRNDLNSTETTIDAGCACDLLRYNETLDTTSSVGASQAATHDASFSDSDHSTYATQNAQNQSSTANNAASEASSASSNPPASSSSLNLFCRSQASEMLR